MNDSPMKPAPAGSPQFKDVLRQAGKIGRRTTSANFTSTADRPMAMRFYCETPIGGLGPCTIAGPEGHHMIHVMRVAVGDDVTVFDGNGGEYLAAVRELARDRAILELREHRPVERELPFDLTLAVALPKGERQKWLVEKAVELGVTTLIPLETRFGVAQPSAGALDRFRRAVVSASKQCGRNRLMEVARGVAAPTYFDQCPQDARRLVADPASTATLAGPLPARVALAVGPEGGFSPEELKAAGQAGWESVSLGNRILRTETAALVLVARLGMI